MTELGAWPSLIPIAVSILCMTCTWLLTRSAQRQADRAETAARRILGVSHPTDEQGQPQRD